ncbi:MAG: arsenate reductase ArsC [Candidatus Dormibacteria bacterium]
MTPTVLLVCVHNAGRSQMAAGFLRHLAGDRLTVLSAGGEPAGELNPVAVAAMLERDIDISQERPRLLSDAQVGQADVVITMGCGDTCPIHPGKRYLDWELDDPAQRPLEEVRVIRDEIERRVRVLLTEIGIETHGDKVPT